MAYLKYENKEIYYEVYGEGKPILMLNGIMMSTMSWHPFIKAFTKTNKLILMDFFDQGKSSSMKVGYNHSLQIEAISELLKELKIDKINIAGISYGGEVGLGFAVKHPEKVEKLVLFNSAARTAPQLREMGHSWNQAAASGSGLAYYLATIPIIYSPLFYEKNADWMAARQTTLVDYFGNKEVRDRLVRLTDSSEDFDVRNGLAGVTAPTLIVSAENDALIPKEEQLIILGGVPNGRLVVLPNCGHASMYEQPELYVALTAGFVNASDIPKIV